MWYGISQCDILKISDDEIAFLTETTDIDLGVERIMEKYQPKLICATMGKMEVRHFIMVLVCLENRLCERIPLRQQVRVILLWRVC